MRKIGNQGTRSQVGSLIKCLFLMVAIAYLFSAPLVPYQAQAQTTTIDPVEMEFWKSVSSSKDAAEFEAYLTAFPDGKFAALARIRLKKLQAKADGPDPKAAVKASSAPIAPPKVAAPPAPAMPATAKAPAPVHQCDRLAANPNDQNKVTEGVSWKNMHAGEALKACRAALKTYPDEPRYHYQLGRALEKQKRHTEALEAFRIAAGNGHLRAMNNVGREYEYGFGVEEDDAEAVRWYRKAAEKGDAIAMSNLARMYKQGEGVSKDLAEAVRWYRKAAENGNVVAMIDLAYMYKQGEGVSKDLAEAVRWFRQAAEKGNAHAMNEVGVAYALGYGVKKDDAEAVRWLRKAAEKGDDDALINLGNRYAQGRGVVKSDVKAVRLMRKAAEKGNKRAAHSLGYMYDSGRGVAKDSQVATQYIFEAIRKRNEFTLDQMRTNSSAYSKEFRRALQRLLKEAGVYSGAIDGVFGPDTNRAIEALAKLPKAQKTITPDNLGRSITAVTPPPPASPSGGADLGTF